ncbi:MAG: hypothetical protein ABIH46_09365, partial [Chloroflexota bacterium]
MKTEKRATSATRGIHWGALPVNYSVNLANSGDDGTFLSGITASFDAWEADLGSSMDFQYNGPTNAPISSLTNQRDGINVVGWASLGALYPNAIAVTSVWFNRATKLIVETDMAFNSDLPWSQTLLAPGTDPDTATGVPGTYDVQNICIHEAGHFLMLNDLYKNVDSEQTLYGYGATGELKKRSLECGDLAGVKKAYP